jgi:hypothetical protein
MLEVILVILILLWLTGNLHISGLTIPDYVLFHLNGHPISLLNLLVFMVICSAVGVLPSPIREIAGVLLLLWVLSILGIIAIAGLSNLLVIAVIVGIIVALLKPAT